MKVKDTICANEKNYQYFGNRKSTYCAMNSIFYDDTTIMTSAGCFNMSCDNDVLKIHINDQTAICETANQEISFNGLYGTIICPNPKHICFIMKHKLPHPKETPTDIPATGEQIVPEQKSDIDLPLENNENPNMKDNKTAIIASVVVIVDVAIVVAVIIVKIRKKRNNDNDSDIGKKSFSI